MNSFRGSLHSVVQRKNTCRFHFNQIQHNRQRVLIAQPATLATLNLNLITINRQPSMGCGYSGVSRQNHHSAQNANRAAALSGGHRGDSMQAFSVVPGPDTISVAPAVQQLPDQRHRVPHTPPETQVRVSSHSATTAAPHVDPPPLAVVGRPNSRLMVPDLQTQLPSPAAMAVFDAMVWPQQSSHPVTHDAAFGSFISSVSVSSQSTPHRSSTASGHVPGVVTILRSTSNEAVAAVPSLDSTPLCSGGSAPPRTSSDSTSTSSTTATGERWQHRASDPALVPYSSFSASATIPSSTDDTSLTTMTTTVTTIAPSTSSSARTSQTTRRRHIARHRPSAVNDSLLHATAVTPQYGGGIQSVLEEECLLTLAVVRASLAVEHA